MIHAGMPMLVADRILAKTIPGETFFGVARVEGSRGLVYLLDS
jgi:hypothetical protein